MSDSSDSDSLELGLQSHEKGVAASVSGFVLVYIITASSAW